MKIFQFLIFVFIICFSACVVPPPAVKDHVLPLKEVQVVSHITRGKNFASAGRMDLAEEQFRLALALAPQETKIYIDLAFVLQGQNRLQEAGECYARVLDLYPEDFDLLNNYARFLYLEGEYEKASQKYQDIVDMYWRGVFKDLQEVKDNGAMGRPLLSAVYKNISTIEYTLGNLGDAVCFSWLSLTSQMDPGQYGRHARLLISLNYFDSAINVLGQAAAPSGDAVNNRLLLDYGVVSFLNGQAMAADQAFGRVLASSSASAEDQRTARLLKLLIVKSDLENNPAREREYEEISAQVAEDFKFYCEQLEVDTFTETDKHKLIDKYEYWPDLLIDEATAVLDSACNGGTKRKYKR